MALLIALLIATAFVPYDYVWILIFLIFTLMMICELKRVVCAPNFFVCTFSLHGIGRRRKAIFNCSTYNRTIIVRWFWFFKNNLWTLYFYHFMKVFHVSFLLSGIYTKDNTRFKVVEIQPKTTNETRSHSSLSEAIFKIDNDYGHNSTCIG